MKCEMTCRSAGLVATVAAVALTGCPTSTAEPAPPPSPVTAGGDFLAVVAEQIGLPAQRWTASGTHTAKGFTTAAAQTTSVAGMKADCDNVNLNTKLASNLLSDVFGPGLKGFFYKVREDQPGHQHVLVHDRLR